MTNTILSISELITSAFFDSFNNVGEDASVTADKYYSRDLQFYAGNTGKEPLDYDHMVDRIAGIRKKMQHVYIVVSDVNISYEDPNYIAETHYVIAKKLDGTVYKYKTSNIIVLKDHKIASIRGVESILSDEDTKEDAEKHRYST